MSDTILEEKPDIIEIKETMKGTFYSLICCLVFCVILLVIVSIAVPSIVDSSSSPFEGFGIIILVVFWVLIVGIMIYIGFKMRGGRKERSFTIIDGIITFENPNRPIFTIDASDFNTLEVSRITGQDAMDIALNITSIGRRSRTTFYKFHFLEAAKSYIVESQRDYSKKGLRNIRNALEQYCQENNKTYLFKK